MQQVLREQPQKKHKCHDHGQPWTTWNAILQTISKFSLFFPHFFSFVRFTIRELLQNIYIQHVFHFNGASQRRHWCMSMGAWCISTQAFVHFNGGIGAFQCKRWCISTGAVLRVNCNWVHWFVELGSRLVLIRR